ncbi:MAG: CBS domain-containing protein [Candidatus Onthovivens sp.]|nr:CBS domain-containing protein [Bacilli bacterium]
MNIFPYLTPKNNTYYIVDNISVRQAIEKFDFYKFSVVPVIDENGKYINSISEGDLLCFIKNNNPISLKDLEKIPLFEVPRYRTYECLSISSTFDEILNLSLNQNFIPIIDDRGMFIGIIKRKDIIKHLLELIKEHK